MLPHHGFVVVDLPHGKTLIRALKGTRGVQTTRLGILEHGGETPYIERGTIEDKNSGILGSAPTVSLLRAPPKKGED